ncbi:GyrI-like domain-containing protein [Bacillus solimangrovi]|uniref:DNA-binding protein n=1 Tax=Bacillus solimangrovi TaxID=1305675 RepID=A0A1E5LD53_9BACI|nr:GyrI-like domain-containing protein [Bacillus solimangrovi]OEH92005.1 DNA-binding protein [Bacillus solimangrovi]
MLKTVQISDVMRKSGFFFIGKAETTTNEAEIKGEGVIPTQWGSLYESHLLEQIPNKKNSAIIALYTDYESGELGEYTFALGSEVTAVDDVPDNLKSYQIVEGNYIVFTTRRGPVQTVVMEAWQYIWEWSKTNERAFRTDFELYDERCTDPENSEVDIYISVK